MARIERRHLEAFEATAEAGSIVAAAARLHVSPSAVSKALSALESSVGQRLFHRAPAGAALTEPAGRLLSPTRRALAIMSSLEDPFRAESDDLDGRGSLHIVAAVSLTPDPLGWIVGEYLRRHRGRRLSVEGLRAPELDSVVDLVSAGHYDVGLTETPQVVPAPLTAVPLSALTFYAALPPGTRTEVPGEVSISEIVRAGLIVGPHWESSAVYRELMRTDPRLRGAVVTRTPHRGHFLDFVRAGLGAALLRGEQALEAVRTGCTVGVIDVLIPSHMSVLHRSDTATPGLAQFVRVCADYTPPVPDLSG